MRIIAYSSGTLLSLFPLEAFTPMGGLNERQIVSAIGQRYNFGTLPNLSSRRELEQNGLVYESGFFMTESGEATIHRLSVHKDGIMVRANETGHAEAFFEDLMDWLVQHYGCRWIDKKSRYLSEVVVEFEKSAANMFAKYDKIADVILSGVNKHMDVTAAAFSALTIEFVSSVETIPKFIIERREGTSVEDERYFCSAPLTTERHLQVLEQIEHLLS